MEEQVGQLWHRLITRAARNRHPQAAVTLHQMHHTLGVVFRALGGDGGLRVEATEASEHHARRGVMQRIAGIGDKAELAWRDEHALRLPATIDYFADSRLNRELYLWLAALAATPDTPDAAWLPINQQRVLTALQRFPGLQGRYARLVQAHLALRPLPRQLPPDEAAQESAIRQALEQPGTQANLPFARRAPFPVPLWLHPSPPESARSPANPGDEQSAGGGGAGEQRQVDKRGRGERHESPIEGRGLITIRMENIFSWGEFASVDRSVDENDDIDQAADAARDADRFSVSRDNKSVASKLRFDLDLPSAECDEEIIEEGQMLPEWDWKRQQLVEKHCRVVVMAAENAPHSPLPHHLARTARQLRAQFQQLMPARSWRNGQNDGTEIDLDAYLRFTSLRAAGQATSTEGLYRDLNAGARDLACLLLADLSLSTDTWVDNHHRVIDVIRDSLYLFSESLAATGDRFSLYGFSSRKRDPIRLHCLKSFTQPYNGRTRGRIQAIKPGYYTRMGAAIRYARSVLDKEPAERRLLLLLSDGKPNDLDKYEGRYGIEDTRHAIRQARRAGIKPFCVTIDEKANDYLPYLFGSGGYVVIRNPRELPRKLPLLYARLTR